MVVSLYDDTAICIFIDSASQLVLHSIDRQHDVKVRTYIWKVLLIRNITAIYLEFQSL